MLVRGVHLESVPVMPNCSRSLTQWLFDTACLIEGHDILMRRSMPNRSMREISVVRLDPMRALPRPGLLLAHL